MDEFRDIPGWPGYQVSRDGRVKGKYGILLPTSGRVTLYHATHHDRKILSTKILVESAWPEAESENSLAKARERAAALELELDKMEKSLAWHRKFNAVLWGRLRKLDAEIDEVGMSNRQRRKRILEELSEWEREEGGWEAGQ